MPKTLLRTATKKILIFINIITSFMFLGGCYASFLFTNKYWFVGFLPIAAFYIFIILTAFFVFWLFARSKWSLLFFIIILSSWSRIIKIVPFRTATQFKLQKNSDDIRVMDWNVAQFDVMNYKKDKTVHNKMIELINKYQPDIACFQEMVAGDSVVDLNNSYYKKYSFYSILDFELALHFPDEYYSYNWKENYLAYQHFGVIIFSKYPIISRHTITTHPNDYNSIFQYVDIVIHSDTLRVFNIHLQSLKFSEGNLQYINNPSVESNADIKQSRNIIGKFKVGFLHRKIQADRIKKELDKSPYPVIICGDFNDLPNSYAYETIGKGLQNVFEEKGYGLGRTFSGIAPTLRIDNIFADKQFRVNQYLRDAVKLSDHFPIITDISLTQNK